MRKTHCSQLNSTKKSHFVLCNCLKLNAQLSFHHENQHKSPFTTNQILQIALLMKQNLHKLQL